MIQTFAPRAAAGVSPILNSTLLTHGTAVHTAGELPELRPRLASVWARTLSASLLRQADDQTVVALAALHQALERVGEQTDGFADWGVLAAPRYLGRAAQAASLERSKVDGPWGVSPHFVPHRSLHSLPGMISLALKAHGPNLGVGGGPGGESEALLAAATFLHADRLPGVWVAFTGWHPEPVFDTQGQVPSDSVCRAVVLALAGRPAEAEGRCLRLRLACRRPEPGGTGRRRPAGEGFTVESLLAALTQDVNYPTTWIWDIEHGAIELDGPGVRGEICR